LGFAELGADGLRQLRMSSVSIWLGTTQLQRTP
jgi:hypothetical protein